MARNHSKDPRVAFVLIAEKHRIELARWPVLAFDEDDALAEADYYGRRASIDLFDTDVSYRIEKSNAQENGTAQF
ncbi:MAG TPA: hypothetical protein VMF53_12185 [Alphaproteobacteria bacterium]|nr:hypothetical protein [Alphaproteobacteria bacterium]